MKSILAKSMSIFLFVFALLILIAVVLIPYLYENTLIATGKQKTLIQLNNVDLWGNFPGKLHTTFRNSFNFFNLDGRNPNSVPNLNLSITNQTFVLDQEIKYENFQFNPKTDTVDFHANSEFTINKNLTYTTEISTISQGLLELLFSLTYPPEYQKGLHSLNILLNKAFGTGKDFVLKLFTVYAFDNLISKREKVEETILKNLSQDKKDLIYSVDTSNKYTLASAGGFFSWVSLVGNNEEIKKATWLSENFKLTESEAVSILGDKSFLYTLFLWFNKDLSFNFKCAKDFCDSELVLRQLTDASVTKYLNVRNIKILNDMIDPSFYPYQTSPELIEYYYLKNNNTTWGFNEINLSNAQLQKLFFEQETKLLEPSNLIDLIYFNSTQDLYSAYNKFLFKSNQQISFVTGYIFEYLVNVFVYDRLFPTEDISCYKGNVEINSLAQGLTSILEVIINRTYSKLAKNIKVITISQFIFTFMKNDLDCNKIILPAVNNDPTRTTEICQNDLTNFSSYKSIKTWVLPHECIYFSDCRQKEKQNLMDLTGMTLEELAIVFKYENLGKLISDAKVLISDTYNCGDCTPEVLAQKQWFESYLTKNPPKTYPVLEPSSTIFTWDNIEFLYPIEINYYADIVKCGPEDCNESSYGKILSLENTFKNSTSFENREAYRNRFLLQKAYSFYLLGTGSNSNYWYDQLNFKNPDVFFNTLKFFISNTIMKNRIVNTYNNPSSLLLGNYVEDEYFLKFLAKGSFYENFKPKIKSTTGFYINVDRIHKQDDITVDTGFKENEYEVRRIKKFNDVPIININSYVYSPNKLDYINKNIPLYDSFRFDSSLDFSDGFQFSTDRDVLYFYDNLSSRVLKFKFSKKRGFKENLNCKEYILTNEVVQNLHENKINEESILDKHHQIGTIFGKFNKPYVISPFSVLRNQTFLKDFKEIHLEGINGSDERFQPSYICLDPFSDMVLESNITLLYSIYTGKLNHIVQDLPENTLIPLFTHTRFYEVDMKSYNSVFPGINDFARSKFISLILGLIIVVILMITAVCLCMRYKNVKFVFIGDKKLILE